MIKPTTDTIKKGIGYWWLYLLTGLVLVGIGIWVFISPAEAYVSLSILFALGMLITGMLETVFSISARKLIDGWGWTLAGGILDVVIGTYLLSYPLVTMQVLPFILGFWLLFRGFSAIGLSLHIKSLTKNWGWLLLLGIFISFFGFMILIFPAIGVLNIILWTALSFIAAGIFRIVLAFKLKKIAT